MLEKHAQLREQIDYFCRKGNLTYLQGTGKMITKNIVQIDTNDGNTLEYFAENIGLAVGSRPRKLPTLPIDGKKVIGYREAMVLPTQPKSMIIVGSGAIGVEFAYFYNNMGTKVTIVEFMPRIVPVEDEDISKELEKSYKKKGIDIMTNASVEKVDTSGNGVKATVKTATGDIVLEADVLLSAVGVVANIENIGLETLNITQDKGKVIVDKFGKTNLDGVYAIGDLTPGQALAHVASKEAIICVENFAHKEGKYKHQPEPIDYGNVPGCTYCSPEIASVGMTEKQAKEAVMN